MRGDIKLSLKTLLEIIALIFIIILLVFFLKAIGDFVTSEDNKYIELVKFIESKLQSLKADEKAMWSDSVIYNPVKYSIYFNYTDGRIYLFKCDSPEMILVFSNVSDIKDNLWEKDLEGSNCYPLYVSTKVLDDRVMVNVTAGPILEMKDGNLQKAMTVKLYDLMYTYDIVLTCIDVSCSTDYYYFLAINNTYDYVYITKDSKVFDISSYLIGVKSSVSRGVKVSKYCDNESSSIKCVLDARELLSKGILTTFKMTVEIKRTSSNTIIIFKPAI